MLEITVFMQVYITGIVFLVGAILGSFLNCVCMRLVRGESYIKGKSHCMNCGHELKVLDLIPIFSWLFQKGRCRYCKQKISARYFITEISLACAFTVTWLVWGISFETLIRMIIECLMLCAALCDFDTREIPDRFFLVMSGLWFVKSAVLLITWDGFSWKYILDAVLGGLVIPLVIFVISLGLSKILKKDTLGFGDIKLLSALGMFMGPWNAMLNIILMCIIGLLVFLISKKTDKAMPLVPAMAISSTITLIVGDILVNLYMKLLFL